MAAKHDCSVLESHFAADGCKGITGFTYPQALRVWEQFSICWPGAHIRDMWATMALVKTSATWDQMVAMQVIWSPDRIVSERQLRRDVGNILNRTSMELMLQKVNRRRRFSRGDLRFPQCFGSVDCTPVPVRGDRRFLNGKYHQKVVKFEVYVDFEGTPFYWSGPWLPNDHDAKIHHRLAEKLVEFGLYYELQHYENEFFLGDQGYTGCCHVICAPKSNERGAQVPVEGTAVPMSDFLKDRIVILRTRIEHVFGHLDRFKFMHDCSLSYQTLAFAFNFVMCILNFLDNHPKYEELIPGPPLGDIRSSLGGRCNCGFNSEEVKDRTKRKREELARHQIEWDVPPVEGKKEKKRARSPSV